MKRGFDRLEKRLAEVEAFDPQSVNTRGDPRVEALEVAVDEALTLAFGYNTVERNRYKDAHKLDRGNNFAKLGRDMNGIRSPQQDAVEARNFLATGKARSLALLHQALSGLEEDIADRELENTSTSTISATITPTHDVSKVFVVHGHDGAPKAEVARFIEKLGFEAIILHERPNKGRALITKFREEAAGVGFAVVLMTPDDLGKANDDSESRYRARQNVVFELGFFIGKLGPEHVAALVKGDVELPSDFDGVVYISLDKEDWQTKLGMELQTAGYEINWNKVMRR